MKRFLLYSGALGVVLALLLAWFFTDHSRLRQAAMEIANQWQRDYADADQDDCLTRLALMNVDYRQPKPLRGPESCGIDKAVSLTRVGAATLDNAPPLSCKMALALAHLEAEVIQPLARQYMGSEVRRIMHFGTYNCRGIRGTRVGLLSQHSYANALDISGFKLANGQTVSVLFDWPSAEPGSTAQGDKRARGEFLHALGKQSCDQFSVVMGPNSNKAHRDHFHLDQGVFSSCQ
jgi:hypothetical protein